MSLKVLFVPFVGIMMLVLTIGFIKPDLGTMEEKKLALATKLEQSRSMATLLGNITALTSDLDSRQESERFVTAYLPKSMDQERVMDMFNYLAIQTGVAMVTVKFEELNRKDASVDGMEATDGLVAHVSGAPKIKTYSAKVTINGNYDNIKSFFDQVAHMNRAHRTKDFSIMVSKDADVVDAGANPAKVLEGVFFADFDYFSPQKVGSALGMPVFAQAELDLSQLTSVLSWVTHTVPALAGGATGRPNPFQ